MTETRHFTYRDGVLTIWRANGGLSPPVNYTGLNLILDLQQQAEVERFLCEEVPE